MFKTHKTQGNRTMMIAQMENDHLHNYMNLMIKKLEDLYDSSNGVDSSEYMRKMYNLPSTVDVANAVREGLESLYPYIAECYLRGINNGFPQRIARLIGRQGAFMQNLLELPEEDQEDSYEYEEDEPFGL